MDEIQRLANQGKGVLILIDYYAKNISFLRFLTTNTLTDLSL